MKLHLGCGKYDWEGYTNIDAKPAPHVKYLDVSQLPFEDNSVDEIYSSHLFAYFDREEGEKILSEWFRVLKPDAKLYIAVPDFSAIKKLSSHFPIEDVLGPLYGKMGETPIYHKTVYDERSLSKLLHKVGFKEIIKLNCGFQHGKLDKDQSWAYLPDRNYKQGTLISLNLIATK